MSFDDHLYIEIDGEGVAPDAVDAAALIFISANVVEMVERLALDRGKPVHFTSLAVIDKCVALRLGVDAPEVVGPCVSELGGILLGVIPPPRGASGLVNELRGKLQKLPKGNTIRLLHGESKLSLKTNLQVSPAASALTSFRAMLQRAGGRRPKAAFQSAFQDTIVLTLSKAKAAELGAYLYQEMDVVAHVHYTADFDIAGGRLVEYHVVDQSREPLTELRNWYVEQLQGDSEDIET